MCFDDFDPSAEAPWTVSSDDISSALVSPRPITPNHDDVVRQEGRQYRPIIGQETRPFPGPNASFGPIVQTPLSSVNRLPLFATANPTPHPPRYVPGQNLFQRHTGIAGAHDSDSQAEPQAGPRPPTQPMPDANLYQHYQEQNSETSPTDGYQVISARIDIRPTLISQFLLVAVVMFFMASIIVLKLLQTSFTVSMAPC